MLHSKTYLVSINEAQNRFRFYQINTVTQKECTSVITSWGRLGNSPVGSKIFSSLSKDKAQLLLDDLIAKKKKNGYVVVS